VHGKHLTVPPSCSSKYWRWSSGTLLLREPITRPHRLRLPPSPASGYASGAASGSASAACAGGGAAAGVAACCWSCWHGWEGLGGVKRGRNLGALASCWGPPRPPEGLKCTLTLKLQNFWLHWVVDRTIWYRQRATFGYTGCSATPCRASLCLTQNGRNTTPKRRVAVNRNTDYSVYACLYTCLIICL